MPLFKNIRAHRRPTSVGVFGVCAAGIIVLLIGTFLFSVVITVLAYLFLPALALGASLGLIYVGEAIRTRRINARLARFSKDPDEVAAFWKGLPRG